MNDDLRIIKKKYGEKMMHLCRELFPSMLEVPNLLSQTLMDTFEPNRFLCDDIIECGKVTEFRDYICSRAKIDVNSDSNVVKSPQELLTEVGYDLYECKTEEDIQFFKKYYASKEALCTFKGNRLDRSYVFFAVKKDADKLRRKDFKEPRRQDEYGTSVISIQFSRGDVNDISIKNRYNHTVENCDATFSNNLDNIVPGLMNSFARKYNFNYDIPRKEDFYLPGYVEVGSLNNKKFYKYNFNLGDKYYCLNNLIIYEGNNGRKVDYSFSEMERYIVMNYFILDLMNKEILCYMKNDAFVDIFKEIDKIDVVRAKKTGNKIISIKHFNGESSVIELNSANEIVKIYDNYLEEIRNNFLQYNRTVTDINLPYIKKIGNYFLERNLNLVNLRLPKLTVTGVNFLHLNNTLSNLFLPELTTVNDRFMVNNARIANLNLPKLVEVKDNFLSKNKALVNLNLPSLVSTGSNFMEKNNKLVSANLPKLTSVGSNFLYYNTTLLDFYSPNFSSFDECGFLASLNFNNKLYISVINKFEKIKGVLAKNISKVIGNSEYAIKKCSKIKEERKK